MQLSNRRYGHIAILILMVVTMAMPARAASFNKASLKGSYSFSTNLRTANGATTQFAMLGVLSFDGAGNVTGSYTAMSGTSMTSGTLGGTYTVASNGTGTLTFTTGSSAQFAMTLNSTTAKIAHGIQLLQTNDSNNEIISGTAVLQATTAFTYSAASLKGNFAFQYVPWTTDATLAQDSGTGIFTFDGKGNVTGAVAIVYDGQAIGGPFSGTYTVNANGTGTISGLGGHGLQMALALNTVTSGVAKGLQFIDTNDGDGPGDLVITGNALKQ